MKTYLAMFVIAVATACQSGPSEPVREGSMGEAPGPVRRVAVAPVTSATAETLTRVPGSVRARQRALLVARSPGAVVKLPYREGEWVESGVVVVRLDASSVQAALDAGRADESAARAELDRTVALLGQDAATPREKELADARLAQASAAVALATEGLQYAALRSPFAGRVAERFVTLGDVVGPGQPLVSLEGSTGFELVASVDAARVRSLHPGLTLAAHVDGAEGPLLATLRAVAVAGDPGTHRFEVLADLEGSTGLRSGLFGWLEIPQAGGEAGLYAPAAALFQRGGLTGVFVVDSGVARLRWIAPGARRGESAEVRAGLEAGELVVLDPAGLADGARVEVVP